MKIDALFNGVEIAEVSKAFDYVDGAVTENQKKDEKGLPVWNVTVALPDGKFVVPCRVKVGAVKEPKADTVVRFVGIEANAWGERNISWKASELVEGSLDGLSGMLDD